MGSVLRAGGKLTAAVHPVATPAFLREMEWRGNANGQKIGQVRHPARRLHFQQDVESLDLYLLQPASPAAFEAHGGFGHPERFGQKRHQGRICFAIHSLRLEFETNHPVTFGAASKIVIFPVWKRGSRFSS